jgi:uncharacterized membrane protein YqgA involved in biofilm formation
MFTGVIVNFAAVIACSAIGLLLGNKLKEKYRTALADAIALGTAGIGIMYIIKTQNILVLMLSLILGTLAGTLLKIDDRLERLGETLQNRFKGKNDTFSEGFAGASILFCVGSMAIMGSLESALSGKADILLTKSIMDGVISVFLASAMGLGVLFSAFPVLIYEGALTLLFSLFAGGIDNAVMTEVSAAGGAVLIGIAINMLKLKKIKTADMIVSLFMPIAVMPLLNLIN